MNIYVVSFLIILFFNIIRDRKSLQVLQSNKYNENNKYIRWILVNIHEVFLSLDLLAVITIFIAYLLYNRASKMLVTISIVFYLLDAIRILNKKQKNNLKRFVVTKRIKRLIVTMSIILMLPVITYIADRDNILLMILIESILTYLSYILILIVNYINRPIENLIHKYKETKAKNKINSMTDLNIVGIIGTRGKTDLKNIFNHILVNTGASSKSTPKNLNTKQGLILTINNVLKNNDKYFITELNTDNKDEFAKINSILNTKYVILTTTDTAYLEYIKNPLLSVKNKLDFINNLPSDGIAILNRDDNKQKSYHFKGDCKKIWIGINNKSADIYADNIKYDNKGTKFDVVFKKDDTKYSFETKILGTYNLYNILASIALAKEFGISIKKLQKAVKGINPFKCKLSIKDCGYMYQINDYNNSTVSEIKTSLEVLKAMPGLKVVVTKGFGGTSDKILTLNHTFGNKIAKVADMVILVNSKNSKEIFVGLMESDYSKDKLYVVNNLKEAYNLIMSINEKNVYALFENIRQDDIMNKE